MKIILEKNLCDEIMWCIFDWYMNKNFAGHCPFVYYRERSSYYFKLYILKGVPIHTACKILCHKWFNIEHCPCHVFGEKEVRKSIEKYLIQEEWIERE